MVDQKKTRRHILKKGCSSLAALSLIPSDLHTNPLSKVPGETKVVYLGGDQLHNGFGQELAMRSIFAATGWRFLFTTDARFVTPELISDADLLIITRWGGAISGWVPGPVVEEPRPSDGYLSPELESAIIDNVKNRGMGFLSLHCTCWAPDYPNFLELLGIRPLMHGPVQTVHLHNFNQNHPITRGIEDFDLPLDENFGIEFTNKNSIPLYESTGRDDKRHDIAGWCIEQGKGRVVGLPAGHTYTSWLHPTYQKLYWRSAHWAMKREIPPF